MSWAGLWMILLVVSLCAMAAVTVFILWGLISSRGDKTKPPSSSSN